MPSLSDKRAAEKARLGALTPPAIDPHPDVQGVLLSDEIIFYAENHNLISPFERENLKPAGYELSVGDEYFLSGEYLNIDTRRPETSRITIPSFEVAVIKTRETLCLPRYLIARWNIRVIHAYSGLLWVGGPQVDPGYVGHLFCPIYNLSDKPVTLNFGEALALMDFVKTSQFDPQKTDAELKRYKFPPKRLIIQDYNIDDLKSALFTRASERLAEFEDTIKTFEGRFITFTQISFAVFALVISLIVASKAGEGLVLWDSIWGALTIGLSVAAILVAFFSYVQWRVGRLVRERYGQIMANRAVDARRLIRRWWWLGLAVTTLFALGAGIGAYWISDPFLRDIRTQRIVTKSDFDAALTSAKVQMRSDLDTLKAQLEEEIRNARESSPAK